MLRLKSKSRQGDLVITKMHFPGIRSVEQTEQKLCPFESVFQEKEKTVTVIVGRFYY